LLEKNGFKVTGFCGLKDYKGGRRTTAKTPKPQEPKP
jgi:hypothetical protein